MDKDNMLSNSVTITVVPTSLYGTIVIDIFVIDRKAAFRIDYKHIDLA